MSDTGSRYTQHLAIDFGQARHLPASIAFRYQMLPETKDTNYIMVIMAGSSEGATYELIATSLSAKSYVESKNIELLQMGSKQMGLTKFFAKDTYTPTATKKELEDLIPKIRGVVHWNIYSDGYVILEYNCHLICADLIETAIAGCGFEVKHILDEPEQMMPGAERA